MGGGVGGSGGGVRAGEGGRGSECGSRRARDQDRNEVKVEVPVCTDEVTNEEVLTR